MASAAAPAVDELVEDVAAVPSMALVVTVGGVRSVSVLVLTRLPVIAVGWLRLLSPAAVEPELPDPDADVVSGSAVESEAELVPGVSGSVVMGMMTVSSVTWAPAVVAAANPGRKLGVTVAVPS